MEANINNEALDDYSTLYYNEDLLLVKAFRDKGYDEDALYEIKLIEVLVDSLICQKKIAYGDD
jgi:hypothetical protein